MSCGTDGFCNGSGGCRLYATGIQCVGPSCSTGTATSARTCNGAGTCQAATTSMCTPFICGATACKTTCASNADCVSPNICIGTACAPMPALKVQYMVVTQAQFIKPRMRIVNTGTTAVALSTLTMRYWYTIDAGSTTQQAACDFATLGCNNVVETFTTVTPARTGADTYFQVGFASGAGNLAGGANTGEIQISAHKSDFSAYTETND